MILGITGHRPDKLGMGYTIPNPMYNYICGELKSTIKKLAPVKVISGVALGVDTWAAEICVELGIPFIAAVPFKGQELLWPEEVRRGYFNLLSQAEKVEIVSRGGFASWKMHARNQWIVDNTDLLLAVFNNTQGGTKNCIDYAIEQKKEIIYIDPRAFDKKVPNT